MSKNKSLSTLFQKLGADPDQLAAFLENPDPHIASLTNQEQQKLYSLAERSGGGPVQLPDDDSFFGGGFYFGADEGSTIYQLYSTTYAPLTPAKANTTENVEGISINSPAYDTNYTLSGPSSISAMQHFTPANQAADESLINTFHDVEIKALNINIDYSPNGPTFTCAAEFQNPSNYLGYLNSMSFEGTTEPFQVQIGGLGVQSQEMTVNPAVGVGSSCSIYLNRKQGYVTVEAPGNFQAFSFDGSNQSAPINPGIFSAGTINVTDSPSGVSYQLFSTTVKPQFLKPLSPRSIKVGSRIVERVPVLPITQNPQSTGATTYNLSGVSANISAVKQKQENWGYTYHNAELTHLQLVVSNSPRNGVMVVSPISKSSVSVEQKTLYISVSFENNTPPSYIYVDGPYITPQKITDIPFDGTTITVQFEEYQGYVTLLSDGSYHKVNLPPL